MLLFFYYSRCWRWRMYSGGQTRWWQTCVLP